MMKTIPRFVVAVPLVIPVTALFSGETLIFVLAGLDDHSVPLIQVRVAVFLASWAVLIYWAAGETDSVRRTVSRTCWAFSTATFLLPIVMIVWGVTTPPDPPDTFFPKWLVLAVFSFLGVILGTVGLFLAVAVSPPGAPERSAERLFREISETVRRIGVGRIALALILLVLGVVVLRVGSTAGFWSEKYTAITTNRTHTCGIRTDGTAHCWGDFREIPPLDERFVAIAPGVGHACGLRENGSLACWGDIRSWRGVSLPADPGIETSGEPFAEITAGGGHICGLRPDGTVECWGDDRYGETSPPDGERLTEISAGRYHTCGIRPDGTGICWGSVDSPPGGEHFKAISSGWDYACGIRVEEDIICWWGSTRSLTGLALTTSSVPGLPSIGGPFVALSSGDRHACGLRPDGSVHCWGASSAHDNYDFGSGPVRGERFVSISSGDNYNCGLRRNGTAKCWGGNWLDERYR